MGQTWSESAAPEAAEYSEKGLRALMLQNTTPFERMSLRFHLKTIRAHESTLTKELGIQNLAGSSLIIRMADQLAFGDLNSNILIAIGYFDGRLIKALDSPDEKYDDTNGYEIPTSRPFSIQETTISAQNKAHRHYNIWRHRLFIAAHTAIVGNEPIIAYEDMCELFQVMISAFDWDPENFELQSIEPVSLAFCDSMLSDFKAPAIRERHFSAILEMYPFALQSLRTIWHRLLVDPQSMRQLEPRTSAVKNLISDRTDLNARRLPEELGLSRQHVAALCAKFGLPSQLELLFRTSVDGFSMKAMEVAVSSWYHSSLLIIHAESPAEKAQDVSKRHSPVDEVIPKAHDVPSISGRPVTIAISISEKWHPSYKKSFGGSGCTLIILEPVLRIIELQPDSIFFGSTIGFGAGLSKPPTLGSTRQEKIRDGALFVDANLETGVLQCIPEKAKNRLDIRFDIASVAVWGC